MSINSDLFNPIKPKIPDIRFYFLDYFYVLLKSVDTYSNSEDIFEHFNALKRKFQLGESQYKKITREQDEELSERQLNFFKSTFKSVISEGINYELIRENKKNNSIELTEQGILCLKEYTKSKYDFYQYLFRLMEQKYFAFYYLVKFCYQANNTKKGLLIFPIYSPRKLGFEKSEIYTSAHIIDYANKLSTQLENDLENFTKKRRSLKSSNQQIINKLVESNLISTDKEKRFDINKYNGIVGKIRDFWNNYFLKKVYSFEYSLDSFNRWIVRAKQLGIIHVTNFFPNENGRIVYPTSLIAKNTSNSNLNPIFSYPTTQEHLFIHLPKWENIQTKFIEVLVEYYYDIHSIRKTHFVNLLDLKEKVCYRLRIPSFLFDQFLNEVYSLNIKGQLKIGISLEADKIPSETTAMYLKREPVLVNGRYINIIAIKPKNSSK